MNVVILWRCKGFMCNNRDHFQHLLRSGRGYDLFASRLIDCAAGPDTHEEN
jgi:hypothetical protein